MTRYQLSQISTMKQVRLVLNRFRALWEGFSGFADQVMVLGAKIELILVLAQEQERDKRGLRADKVRLTELLSDAVMAVAGPLGGWALLNHNEAVRQQVDVVPSSLRKLAAERLLMVAKDVLAMGKLYQQDAADYALTPGELEVLESRVTAFEQLVAAPREGQARTATLTQLIESEVSVGMELLRLFFDRVMYRFKESHAEFYTNYHTARKVFQPSYRKEGSGAGGETPAVEVAGGRSLGSGDTAVAGADDDATAEEVAALVGEVESSGAEGATHRRVEELNGANLAG